MAKFKLRFKEGGVLLEMTTDDDFGTESSSAASESGQRGMEEAGAAT